MPREDWRDLEAERMRRLHDRDRGDFGQADYSNLYGYDPRTRTGYRNFDDGRGDRGAVYDRESEWDYGPERRSYLSDDERRSYRSEDERRSRRDGPSDRVLWAVIMERLDDERRLDLRDVEVHVHHGEVTLNGTVRRKSDKRRIEDVADIEGVRNVQNNLRVREAHRPWMLF
jgi:hypothetical protein